MLKRFALALLLSSGAGFMDIALLPMPAFDRTALYFVPVNGPARTIPLRRFRF